LAFSGVMLLMNKYNTSPRKDMIPLPAVLLWQQNHQRPKWQNKDISAIKQLSDRHSWKQ